MARRVARLAAALSWWVGICLLANHAQAVEVPGWTAAAWSVEEGLPQSSVESIAETPDGYLWLATYNGLARFDGVRFTHFNTGNLPGMPGHRLEQLHLDREGALWMVTEQNRVGRLKDGQCRTLTASDGVPEGGAQWVNTDGRGGLWLAGVRGGLWRWQDGRFVPGPSPPIIPESQVRRMVADAEGRTWFNHKDRLFSLEQGGLVRFKGPDNRTITGIRRVCASRDGGLWVMTLEGLTRIRHGRWLSEEWARPDFKGSVSDLLEDMAGNLWVAIYDNGLFRFHPTNGWTHLGLESGLPTLAMRSLHCDREGNLWAGTDGSGLLQVKPRLWRMLTQRNGLGVEAVQSLTEDPQGRVWLAGGTHTPYLWDRNGVSAALTPPLSDALDSVWAVLSARDGAMWIGTYVGTVFEYRQGALKPFSATNGLRAGSVRALFEDRQGRIWVGGFDGLSQIDHGRVTHCIQREGLAPWQVSALAEDSSGRLYVGTTEAGLNVLQDGKWVCYTRQDGLPDDHISSLYVDREDVLWIGTHSGGLSRFKGGSFFNFQVKGGLPARLLSSLIEDNGGRLWMTTELGIVSAQRDELVEFAAGRRSRVGFVTFDRSDGLATVEVGGIQPSCVKTREGSLWFATAKGAAFIDPQGLRANPFPPPVVIEEVRIDDRVIDELSSRPCAWERGGASRETARRHARLSPRQNRLEFRYTGLSYAAPTKVRFRYRMDGFENDWVEGGTARSATYTRLPPGTYRFYVTACNNDGVWNENGASLGVVVLPPLHQTWWFRGLGICVGAGLIWGLVQMRISRLNQLARLRSRIAGDLHDEIGSNLGSIILYSELVQQTPALPTEAHAPLDCINTTAQRTANSMRDIVWFLNPEFDTLADMVARMREFASTLLRDCRWEFIAPDLPVTQPLPLEFRRNVFFAFKEILHNIVKHAGAHRVEIRLDWIGGQFNLRVEDNGGGFDPVVISSGHGLRSLRQRATDLGGCLSVQSAPGKGTTVVLTAPLVKPGSRSAIRPLLARIRGRLHQLKI